MPELGHLDNVNGELQVVQSVNVSQEQLGTNCWNPSRFLGGDCDMWHDCHYPEK